ncbi:hypothetical protein FWK35_00013191, partial [Aphis craccivora]
MTEKREFLRKTSF